MSIAPIDGVYVAVIILLCVTIIRAFIGNYALDDSFIGYDNAQNLVNGHGFSFNPGDRVLTTSAPLAVFLYAAVSIMDRADIVSIAQTFAAFACLIIGLVGYALVRKFAAPEGALAATIVLLGSPYTLLLWSHESYLCLAMILVALFLLEEGYPTFSAVTLGLATLMRPEAVLVIPLVAARMWLRGQPAPAYRFTGIALLPVVAWTVAAFAYFGTATSQSVAAKHAELLYNTVGPYFHGISELPSQVYALGFFQVIPHLLGYAVVISWVAAIAGRLTRRVHWLILVWAAMYTALYAVVGVPFFIWFTLQIGVLLALCTTLAFPPSLASQPGARGQILFDSALTAGRLASLCVAGINLLFLLVITGQPYRLLTFNGTIVMPLLDVSAYRQLGVWLSTHTAPSDTVAYPEIGQLRYYSGRSIVDFEGLVNPGVARHVAVGDTIWAFKRYRPTIYIDQPSWYPFVQPVEYDWFARAYRRSDRVPIMMFPFGYNFDIYRLVDASAIPVADDLDTQVTVTSLRTTPIGATISFSPSRPSMDQVDVRLIAIRGCVSGALELKSADGSRVALTKFRLPPSPKPARVSAQFAPIIGQRPTAFVVSISGCRELTLSPRTELRRVGLLDTTMPVAPPGPASSSLSVYSR